MTGPSRILSKAQNESKVQDECKAGKPSFVLTQNGTRTSNAEQCGASAVSGCGFRRNAVVAAKLFNVVTTGVFRIKD